MKTLLIALTTVIMLAGCASTKEINVEMISAELVKIDTVYRGSHYEKQQLTWRATDNLEYVTLVSLSSRYPLGMVMTLLRQR